MKRIKTSLKDLLARSLYKRASLLCLFISFLIFNLITTSVYAQSSLFGKNSFVAQKIIKQTINKAKSSGQTMTAMSFDQDIVRPDHASSKNPDFFDLYAITDDLYVSSKRLSSDSAFHDETLISSFSGTPRSRAPPVFA